MLWNVVKCLLDSLVKLVLSLWNIVKSLVKFVLSFPGPENVSAERSPADDPSDSENRTLVMGLMQKQELSKSILLLALTLSFGLYIMRRKAEMQFVEELVIAASMLGVCLIYNGILVPECTPTFTRYAELVGVGLVISGVYLLLAITLMLWLRIILALCWGFCIRPLIMAAVFANKKMIHNACIVVLRKE